jgi:hypothetical protein
MFGESMSQPRIHVKKTGNKHEITNSIKIATFPKQVFLILKGSSKKPQIALILSKISQARVPEVALTL